MIGVVGVIVGISIGVLWANLFFFLETPYGDNSVSLRFEKGTSVSEILKKLEANQVISNISFFKAYLWFTHTGPNLRAGEYIFPPRQTPREVLSRLLKGDFSTHKITIPEGWTARQIAIHLASLELVDPQAFLLKCIDQNFIKSLGLSVPTLEGYLYPDTYEIYKPKDEEEVIRKMVERFKEVYIKNFAGQESHVGLPIESVITLASIVEKVTGKRFPVFMKETFFDPLGMTNSWINDVTDTTRRKIAISYNSRWIPQKDDPYDGVYGDKGLYSSTADMLKWNLAFYQGKLISNEIQKEAYAPRSFERP